MFWLKQDEASGYWSVEETKHGLRWLHNSILISNFLHFDDRKNPSQFRQKMNVYGLVRPQVLILKS